LKLIIQKKEPELQFPVFPHDIVQGLAKRFVDLYTPIRDVPEAFLWLSFITYFGNAISPYAKLNCASSEPRLFGVAIGPSARSHKSTANNLARDLFKGVAAKGVKQNVMEGFGSAEGLLRELGQSPGEPTIIHLDEINILAKKTDTKGSVGISAFHKLFEDHDYKHALAMVTNSVRDVYLSLLSASTQDDFTRTWSAAQADAGFFSRLLLVGADAPDRKNAFPTNPEQTLLNNLIGDVYQTVNSIQKNPAVLTVDADARVLWEKFYDAFGEGPEWNRIDSYGFRLMTIQSILEGRTSVSKTTIQRIIDFLQYEVAVRQLLAPITAENPHAEMEELIRKHLPPGGKSITRRQLSRRTNANRKGIMIFDRALDNLKREGELVIQPQGKTIYYSRSELSPTDAAESTSVVNPVIMKMMTGPIMGSHLCSTG
jgi:hypothetical protein